MPTDFGTIVPNNSIFGPFQPLSGFHQTEEDELGPFVWTRKIFRACKPSAVRWVEIDLCYYGENGKVLVNGEGCDRRIETGLHSDWGTYWPDLSSLIGPDVEFEVDPLIHVPGDSRELGVMLRSFEPLKDLEHAKVPLCREPWETIYVLRRGIMPCCFSKSPLFTWGELRDKTLAQFVKEAWNSPIIQEIRVALAQLRLHERCAETKSCPIVKKWFMRQAK